MKKYSLPLIACVALGACSTYAPPASGPGAGPTAKLRFVSLPGTRTEIATLREPDCDSSKGSAIATVGLFVKGGLNQGQSQKIPLQESVQRPTATEILIPAGTPFAAQFEASPAKGPRGADWTFQACSKGFVLVAEPGGYYEAQLEQMQGGCALNVFRITREKDGSYARRLADKTKEVKALCN